MKKPKHVSTQFIYYFIVALIGYLFDFCTLLFLTEIIHINYLLSASIGFIIGLIIVYILSNIYVFGESKIKSKSTEFMIFTLIGVIGLGILTLFMWILTDKIYMNYILSKIVATTFVYIWNFFARRTLYHN